MTDHAANTIILCGAPINYAQLPIGTNYSNAMVPINGKPVIGWILDDLIEKEIRCVTIVLRTEDVRFRSFLERSYGHRLELKLVPLPESRSILTSLRAGLKVAPTSGVVRVVLGDTLIRDAFSGTENFVYVGDVPDSRRWCLTVLAANARVVDYIDKKPVPGASHQALAGYYHFQAGADLLACVEASIAAGERELSGALRRYGEQHAITARRATHWYDFGHIDTIVEARRRLLRPRAFNSLTVNPILSTITKVSRYDEKLQDELDWYRALPGDLNVLTPRLLGADQKDGKIQIVQEYYGYPTLAELFVYGELDAETWTSILRRVLAVHLEFRRYAGTVPPEVFESMYFRKTSDRLAALARTSAEWSELLARRSLVHNGRVLRGWNDLRGAVQAKAMRLAGSAKVAVIHGDYCFSNILFDPNNQIIRVIDPRGSFGVKGIHGDTRYDIAKLRHSVSGLYDFIVADMFDLNEIAGEFVSRIYAGEACATIAASLDTMVGEIGYDVSDIRFIEGLLFVSMVPLHEGQPQRQRLMYLTGLVLLNDVLG